MSGCSSGLSDDTWTFGADSADSDYGNSIQNKFDDFYKIINQLLDQFFPLTAVTITNHVPPYTSPVIKYMLRNKNKLVRKGQIEKANCIADKIRAKTVSRNSSAFTNNPIKSTKDLWAHVRSLTGKGRSNCSPNPNTSADILNASISTDLQYEPPRIKQLLTAHLNI